MTEFIATINQAPHGKGRPRATSINGRARMFTPNATREWEHFAATELRASWAGFMFGKGPIAPATGPLGLEIVAVFPRTAPMLKRDRKGSYKFQTCRLPYTQKPDADNVAKSACDALQNAGVIGDDKQIALLTIGKHYAMIGELPHVEIRLWSME